MYKQIYTSEKSLNFLIRELSEMCDTIDWKVRLQEIKEKAFKLDGDDFDYRFIQMLTFSLRYDKMYYNYDKVMTNIYRTLLENGLDPNHSHVCIYCFNDNDFSKYSLKYGAGVINNIYDYYLKTTFVCRALNIKYSLSDVYLTLPDNAYTIDLMSSLNTTDECHGANDFSIYPIPWTSCCDPDERLPCIALLNLLNTCYADTITQEERYKNIEFNVVIKGSEVMNKPKVEISMLS